MCKYQATQEVQMNVLFILNLGKWWKPVVIFTLRISYRTWVWDSPQFWSRLEKPVPLLGKKPRNHDML
jgi:hypothetical protein